jgi:SAM-dependent methyltransferase
VAIPVSHAGEPTLPSGAGQESTPRRSRPFCPLCGGPVGPGSLPVRENSDGPIDGDFAVRTCARCGLRFTDPQPAGEELGRAYSTGVYQRSGGRALRIVQRLLAAQDWFRLRRIGTLRRPGLLLDVSCGKGRFLDSARRAGWTVVGVDPVFGQVAAARARYGVPVCVAGATSLPFEAGTFDVATAWHCLEHSESPLGMLGEVARVLKPGGLLVVEVPNSASWQARIGEAGWFHLDVPRHLFHFSPRSLSYALAEVGLDPVGQSTFGLEASFYGMLQSILNRAGQPPNWLFRWLKRSQPSSIGVGVRRLAVAAVYLLPSALLEVVAIRAGAGGVLQAVSRKSD